MVRLYFAVLHLHGHRVVLHQLDSGEGRGLRLRQMSGMPGGKDDEDLPVIGRTEDRCVRGTRVSC